MQKKWVVKPGVPPEMKDRFPQIEEKVLQLLVDRGLKTQEEIDEFLNPDYGEDLHDPFLFKNMKAGVQRLFQAIGKEELITIYGDYDADGVSGSVILATTLQALGAKIDVYLPHRDKEGYGLNLAAIDYIKKQGTKVMITVDCGISNVKEIDYAVEQGLEVIVTDHHQQQEKLPAAINIHPKIAGETYPFKGLAGGGVAYKLAQGLVRTKLKNDPKADAKHWEGFEKWLLDMVAISTVADMMPLLGENRTLVKYGLVVMNKGRRPGLRQILKVAGLWPDGKNEADLDAFNIGFQIAPRINAAGRMNHANVAYRLLMATDEAEVTKLADELNENNRERQLLTQRIIKEAVEQIGEVKSGDVRLISAFKSDWPLGVAGLVAGKLVELYCRPVMVMGLSEGRVVGSVRSVSSFNFVNALMEVKDLFAKFGGHPMAGGFTLARNEDMGVLVEKIDKIIKRELVGRDLTPELLIDRELKLKDVDWSMVDILDKFEPFGKENPVPRFVSRGVKIIGLDAVGADGKHLRMMVGDDSGVMKKGIGFSFGHWSDKIKVGDRIDLVYEIEVNEWNGSRDIQLKIVDLKLCTKN